MTVSRVTIRAIITSGAHNEVCAPGNVNNRTCSMELILGLGTVVGKQILFCKIKFVCQILFQVQESTP